MTGPGCPFALRRAALGAAVLAGSLAGPPALRAQAPADTLSLYRRGLVAPVDPNGFLLNPRWLGASPPSAATRTPAAQDPPPDVDRRCRFRAATGSLGARYLMVTRGPCLSADELQLVTLDETASPMGSGFVCSTNSLIGDIHGHVNWFPVTVTGQLTWAGYSPLPGDQDFSFDLGNTPGPAAATSGDDRPRALGRRPAYRIEFSHPETLQRLIAGGTDAAQAWWTAYGDSLRRLTGEREGQSWWVALFDSYANDAAMHRLVDGRVAVVTGLYGLDAVHEFQAELHPAYAMFVLVDTTRTARGLREEWAFLVRNLGNEGDCSEGTLPMVTSAGPVEGFGADLGAWPGAGAPRAVLGPTWSTDPARVPGIVRDTTGGALLVALRIPRPKADAGEFLAFGTLYVEWPRDGAGSPLARFYASRHPWLASRAIPVNLAALAPPGAPPRNRLDDARELLALPESSGVRALHGAVVPVPPRALAVADSVWTPPDTVVASRTIPLVPWTAATRGCGLEGADPICGSPVQFLAFGANAFDDLFLSPVYVYSRVLRVCSDDCLLGQILGTLAYRLDLSQDRFRRSCVRLPCTPTTVPGWSVRLSPILNGNSFRLGAAASLAPYTVGSLGVSFLVGQRASPLLAVGFGLRLHTGYFDVFAEGQDDMRTAGRYENRWFFPVGVQLDLANILR